MLVQVEALRWARERHCLAFRIPRVETGFRCSRVLETLSRVRFVFKQAAYLICRRKQLV